MRIYSKIRFPSNGNCFVSVCEKIQIKMCSICVIHTLHINNEILLNIYIERGKYLGIAYYAT